MEIEVVRISRFQGKNGFLGYATVKLSFEEYSMVINGFTISETKSGKIIGKPPQAKSPKDDKWYDTVTLEDTLFWKVSDEIVKVYSKGGSGTSSQRSEDNSSDEDSPTEGRTAAARSKVDMARQDGLDKTITKTGKFNPWTET